MNHTYKKYTHYRVDPVLDDTGIKVVVKMKLIENIC